MTQDNDIPVGIAWNEDASSSVGPLSGQECPICGYEYFSSVMTFSGAWAPKETSKGECPQCGTVFGLYAKVESKGEVESTLDPSSNQG